MQTKALPSQYLDYHTATFAGSRAIFYKILPFFSNYYKKTAEQLSQRTVAIIYPVVRRENE